MSEKKNSKGYKVDKNGNIYDFDPYNLKGLKTIKPKSKLQSVRVEGDY